MSTSSQSLSTFQYQLKLHHL